MGDAVVIVVAVPSAHKKILIEILGNLKHKRVNPNSLLSESMK